MGAARKILEVDLLSTLALSQEVIRDERLRFAESRGAIVTLSSAAGQVPSPAIGWYGIGKAAVSHLTRTLGAELAPGLRVSSVSPAVIKTPFSRALYEGKEDDVAADYPLGRLGAPDDVAAAVAYWPRTTHPG